MSFRLLLIMNKILKNLDPDVVFSGSYASLKDFFTFAVISLGGYFIKEHIFLNSKDRQYFTHFIRHNPSLLDPEVESRDIGIHKVSLAYTMELGLEEYYLSHLEDISIARRILFGLFCREENVLREYTTRTYRANGKVFRVDDLDGIGLFDPKGITFYSIPSRATILPSYINFQFPKLFKNSWKRNRITKLFNHLCASFYKNARLFPLPRFYDLYTNNDLVDNWIWPINQDDIHADKREYPGFPEKVDGYTKMQKDMDLLAEIGIKVRNYKFGLYPKGVRR